MNKKFVYEVGNNKKKLICYEFVILKLAVGQASFFQIWNIYCNISFGKDQICGQEYALV
jgi:hypothetical protein